MAPADLSRSQLDISLCGTCTSNADKNLNQHSQHQGLSNSSDNLLTRSKNYLGKATAQPSVYRSNLMSQKCNFSLDQISTPDVFNRNLSGNYSCSKQGLPMQINASHLELEGRCPDKGQVGSTPQETSDLGLSHPAALRDQLEHKCLCSLDENIWDSSCRSSKTSHGVFQSMLEHGSHVNALSLVQGGRKSAVVQLSVAETYSSDAEIQEDRSGVSFEKSEPLNGNQSLNLINGEIHQVNQLDTRRSSIDPENMETLIALSGVSSDYHGESITAPSGNVFHQLQKDDTSNHQMLSMQMNSKDSFTKETSIAPFPKPCTSSSVWSDCDFRWGCEDPQTKQSHSFSPSMVSTSSRSVSGHIVDYIKTVDPLVPSHATTEFPAYSATANSAQKFTCSSGTEFPINVPASQPSSGAPHHNGFPLGLEIRNGEPYSASQFGTFLSGWNFSEKDQGDPPSKTASTVYNQNFQQMDVHDTPCNEASEENKLKTQLKLASFSQGSSLLPSAAATSAARKQLISPDQIPDASISEKHEAFDIWCKDVEHEIWSLPDTRSAEFVWSRATSRRSEEVTDEADTTGEFFPIIRAKRRLICSTQLMQQLFPPAPMVILCSDASSHSDCVAYSEARLTLEDVCRLTGQLLPNTSDTSTGMPKTLSFCKYAKAAEGLNNKVKKIEVDLSRLKKSSSPVDLKVQARELEKFAIINRFAKFYNKTRLNAVNPASPSSTSTLRKTKPQRYVTVVPVPKAMPEVANGCLSL